MVEWEARTDTSTLQGGSRDDTRMQKSIERNATRSSKLGQKHQTGPDIRITIHLDDREDVRGT